MSTLLSHKKLSIQLLRFLGEKGLCANNQLADQSLAADDKAWQLSAPLDQFCTRRSLRGYLCTHYLLCAFLFYLLQL